MKKMVLSTLNKTWIFDLDGTILKHNGYKIDGKDSLLDGAKEYINSLPKDDYVLILTSRTEEYKQMTLDFLQNNDIRYDNVIFNMPYGERIVVNDRKPSGLDMSIAININRDVVDFPIVFREK